MHKDLYWFSLPHGLHPVSDLATTKPSQFTKISFTCTPAQAYLYHELPAHNPDTCQDYKQQFLNPQESANQSRILKTLQYPLEYPSRFFPNSYRDKPLPQESIPINQYNN